MRRRGIDVLTSQEDGTDRWHDERLLKRATNLGRLLFSQDDDLRAVAAAYQQESRAFSGVVYAHQLSAGIGTLVKDLELVATCCILEELVGRVMYIPLG